MDASRAACKQHPYNVNAMKASARRGGCIGALLWTRLLFDEQDAIGGLETAEVDWPSCERRDEKRSDAGGSGCAFDASEELCGVWAATGERRPVTHLLAYYLSPS